MSNRSTWYDYYVNNHIRYNNYWLEEILKCIHQYKYLTDNVLSEDYTLNSYVNILRVNSKMEDDNKHKYTMFNLMFTYAEDNKTLEAILYITRLVNDKKNIIILFTGIIKNTREFQLIFEGLI